MNAKITVKHYYRKEYAEIMEENDNEREQTIIEGLQQIHLKNGKAAGRDGLL